MNLGGNIKATALSISPRWTYQIYGIARSLGKQSKIRADIEKKTQLHQETSFDKVKLNF